MNPREKRKGVGSNEKEERCVDPRGKRKGVWIQEEKEKVCGSQGKGSWNIDPNVNILCEGIPS